MSESSNGRPANGSNSDPRRRLHGPSWREMQQIIVRALDLTEAAHFLFKNKPKIDPQDGNVECAAHAHRFMIAAITLGDLLSLRTGGQSPVSIGWPLSIFTQLTILRNHLMAFWTCSRLD